MFQIFHDPVWAPILLNLVQVVLTLLTFVVLCFYAWDTRKIARANVKQLETAQTPFLVVTIQYEDEERLSVLPRRNKRWAIENQGNSAALNITVKGDLFLKSQQSSSSLLKSFNPVKAGGSAWLGPYCEEEIRNCEIRYESMDGRKFLTQIVLDGEELRVMFRKL